MEWITAVLDWCLRVYQDFTAWGKSLRAVEFIVLWLLFLSYLELIRIRWTHQEHLTTAQSIRGMLADWRFDWDQERRPPLP
jgi:hypothetical protein